MTRQINQSGLAIEKKFEGGPFLQAYRCPAGVWTIGYGHTRDVVEGMTCTVAQAEAWLLEDNEDAQDNVSREVSVPLNDNQFSALVSFVFNLGAGALAHSTLLRLLNAGKYDEVPGQLAQWCHADGVTLEGLVRRRAAEAALWNTPST